MTFDYGPPADLATAQKLNRILEQCFVSPPGYGDAYLDRVGLANFRGLHQGDRMIGGLATLPMGQWFGGRRVDMTGIAAVGIAPDQRGSGAAVTLMRRVVQELYAHGVAISTLYPAAQRLYRKVGYEQGGHYCGWEIEPRQIQMDQVEARSPAIEPVSLESAEFFRTLYHQQAQRHNGCLDRSPVLWQRILEAVGQEAVYGYCLGTLEQPEGYLLFTQERTDSGTSLQIRDWVCLTTAAGQAFWQFLANHRSQIDRVQWRGAAIDALTLLLAEQTAKLKFAERWMVRIINVVKALEQRGYPNLNSVELHLDLQDELIAENSGRFVLSVADGQGQVRQGGQGHVKLTIRGLAPLYTGLFSAQQLQQMGLLQGPESDLAIATQLFAGGSPWMPDFF